MSYRYYSKTHMPHYLVVAYAGHHRLPIPCHIFSGYMRVITVNHWHSTCCQDIWGSSLSTNSIPHVVRAHAGHHWQPIAFPHLDCQFSLSQSASKSSDQTKIQCSAWLTVTQWYYHTVYCTNINPPSRTGLRQPRLTYLWLLCYIGLNCSSRFSKCSLGWHARRSCGASHQDNYGRKYHSGIPWSHTGDNMVESNLESLLSSGVYTCRYGPNTPRSFKARYIAAKHDTTGLLIRHPSFSSMSLLLYSKASANF